MVRRRDFARLLRKPRFRGFAKKCQIIFVRCERHFLSSREALYRLRSRARFAACRPLKPHAAPCLTRSCRSMLQHSPRARSTARSYHVPTTRPHVQPDFAHLVRLKHFAGLTSFRAFAPKSGEISLTTHPCPPDPFYILVKFSAQPFRVSSVG